MGIGIVTPSENARIWDVQWKEVTKPVDVICRPSLLPVSVESMDSHDTAKGSVSVRSTYRQDVLYSRTGSMPSARTLIPYGRLSCVGFTGTVTGAKGTVC